MIIGGDMFSKIINRLKKDIEKELSEKLLKDIEEIIKSKYSNVLIYVGEKAETECVRLLRGERYRDNFAELVASIVRGHLYNKEQSMFDSIMDDLNKHITNEAFIDSLVDKLNRKQLKK